MTSPTTHWRLRNGRLIDPAQQRDEVVDLYLMDGKVAGLNTPPTNFYPGQEIDAQGSWIIPGIVELSAHLGHSDQTLAIASESKAGIAGGITTLAIPPDIHPCIDNPAVVELIQLRGGRYGQAHLRVVGGLTTGLNGEALTEMAALKEAGCVAISNGQRTVTNSLVLRRAMEYAASHDLTILLYASDPWLSASGCAHEGATSTRLGLPSIPSAAETIGIHRDLALVELTGVRAHFCRLTSAGGVRLIEQAKAKGLAVTADVAVHHLHLCDENLINLDTRYRVDPPLRSRTDRQALRDAVASGVIDAICSDHRPLSADAKRSPYPSAKAGISGLETLVPLTLALINDGLLSPTQAISALTAAPARLLNLDGGNLCIGAAADLCLINPQARWQLAAEHMHSSGRNNPFTGNELAGRVTHTFIGGELVYRLSDNPKN